MKPVEEHLDYRQLVGQPQYGLVAEGFGLCPEVVFLHEGDRGIHRWGVWQHVAKETPVQACPDTAVQCAGRGWKIFVPCPRHHCLPVRFALRVVAEFDGNNDQML